MDPTPSDVGESRPGTVLDIINPTTGEPLQCPATGCPPREGEEPVTTED